MINTGGPADGFNPRMGSSGIDNFMNQQAAYDYYEPIEKAYAWNSARLLEMIMGECQLVDRLNSINHYFLFDRGDLFTHFFDGCKDLLDRITSDVKRERLES